MAKITFPYRRLADQFHKVARGKQSPEEWRRVGSLIDRNFEEIKFVGDETLVFHLRDAGTDPTPVVVSESDDHPVRHGGRPSIVAQVKDGYEPTAAVEVTAYVNGVSIGTIEIPIGEAQSEVTSFDVLMETLDTARTGVTDAGTGAAGLVVVWWLE